MSDGCCLACFMCFTSGVSMFVRAGRHEAGSPPPCLPSSLPLTLGRSDSFAPRGVWLYRFPACSRAAKLNGFRRLNTACLPALQRPRCSAAGRPNLSSPTERPSARRCSILATVLRVNWYQRRCQRLDRALHDTRAKIANQRLHERVLRNLLLRLLLALRANSGVNRGGRATRRADIYVHVDRPAELIG